MFDYNASAETALGLLANFGKPLPLARTATVIDPITGKPVSSTTNNGTITAVSLPARKGTVEGFDRIHEKETLKKEEIKYIIAAAKGATFAPDLLDVLTIDGASWLVRGIGVLAPAGIPVIFKLGAVKL